MTTRHDAALLRVGAHLVFVIALLLFPSCTSANAQSEGPAPVASAAPPSPAQLLERALSVIAENGRVSELSPELANALGFTKDEHPWPYKGITSIEEGFVRGAPMHAIAVGNDQTEDAAIFVRKNAISHLIRIDAAAHVLKAIAIDESGHKTLVSKTEAQSEVIFELQYWGAHADRAAHWQVCNAATSGALAVGVDEKITACTWIIQSGQETPRALANAYTSRAMGFDHRYVPQELQDLNEAIRLDPTSTRAWAQLCAVQNWASKDTQLAIQSCSKAIELDPKAPEGWTFRGDIYLRNKDYDLAIADYDHAIELGPEWMWPLDNRGEAYLRKNQLDDAIEDFGEVIRVSPDHAMGYLDRGIAEILKKDLDAALADFQTGLKVEPKCASCLLGQGLVKRARGDTAGGDADIAKAREMAPAASHNFEEDGIVVP